MVPPIAYDNSGGPAAPAMSPVPQRRRIRVADDTRGRLADRSRPAPEPVPNTLRNSAVRSASSRITARFEYMRFASLVTRTPRLKEP